MLPGNHTDAPCVGCIGCVHCAASVPVDDLRLCMRLGELSTPRADCPHRLAPSAAGRRTEPDDRRSASRVA